MQQDLQKRDYLLAKAKYSIVALSKENEYLYRLLVYKNAEILNLHNSRDDEAKNTVRLSANTTGEFFNVKMQPYVYDSSTPSLISTDYYNTALNNVELRRSEEITMFKYQMQLYLEGYEAILMKKIEYLKRENNELKLTEQQLREYSDKMQNQLNYYRTYFEEMSKQNADFCNAQKELEKLQGICAEEKKTKESLYSLLDVAEQRISYHIQDNAQIATYLEQQKSLIAQLEAEATSRAARLSDLEFSNKQHEYYLEETTYRLQLGNEENNKLMEELKTLEYQKTHLASYNEQATRIRCELDYYKARNADLERYLAEQTDELADLRVLTQNAAYLQAKFSKQQVVLQQTENERKMLESYCYNLHLYAAYDRASIEELSRTLTSLKFDNDTQNNANQYFREQAIYRQQLIDSLLEKVAQLESSNSALASEKEYCYRYAYLEGKTDKDAISDMKAQISAAQTKIYHMEEYIQEKNELLQKTATNKSEAQAKQNLFYRLFDEISRELQLYVSPESGREDIQNQFQYIISQIKNGYYNYTEAQYLVQEFQAAIERLNEKQLKQEQLLKLAKDEIIRKQENEAAQAQTITEMQKQLAMQSEQIQNMQAKLLGEDQHKQRLKQYVQECKEKISAYELKNQEYHAYLEAREADVEGQVARLHYQVSTSIQEFSFNVLQQLKSENKEQAINEILKLSKTFLV